LETKRKSPPSNLGEIGVVRIGHAGWLLSVVAGGTGE